MSVICCKCGSTEVSCEAIINPNTKELINYTDESFEYGWCDKCNDDKPLTDTEEVKKEIDAKLIDFESTFGKKPLYASCQVAFVGTDDPFQDLLFKLSSDVGNDDDEVFFYCNGIEELKSLTELTTNDFIITEIYKFKNNLS